MTLITQHTEVVSVANPPTRLWKTKPNQGSVYVFAISFEFFTLRGYSQYVRKFLAATVNSFVHWRCIAHVACHIQGSCRTLLCPHPGAWLKETILSFTL